VAVPPVIDELKQIAAARRDPRAFAPLYDAYADLVWRYAMRRLGDEDRAAEVTSVTFARAIAGLSGFQPRSRDNGSGFRSWLMTIARNALIDTVRRDRPDASLGDPAIEATLVDDCPTPEDAAIATEEQRRVREALSKLSPSQRRIVELRLAGFRSAEIAETLGMSVSAVNTAHFRAFARLRDLLAVADTHRGSPR
jgi:RNA polymerase sigma-70 factor (ECF subfamily)